MTSAPPSRKGSVTSLDDSNIDQAGKDSESCAGDSSNFTAPVDEILSFIKDVYVKKRKISSKDMEFIDRRVHEMKNRIINSLLQKSAQLNYYSNDQGTEIYDKPQNLASLKDSIPTFASIKKRS
jgi:hypothetical protein